MPEIIETTAYRLDELSDAAKDAARAWYRQAGFDHDWFEFVFDDFERICAILGVELRTVPVRLYGGGTRQKPCIFFSGFWSQGDGACFEGRYLYARAARRHIRDHAPKDSELHRIADALLRDSHLDGTAFRLTDAGKALTEARVNHAAPLFRYCPTALVFGVWDSTGPLGGLGAKFTRCLVSEIVGIGAATGVKTASRIDPAQVSSKVPLFAASGKDERWTSLEDEAQKKGKKPVSFGEGKEKGKQVAGWLPVI